MDRRSGGVSGGKGLFWFVHILIWWVDVMGTWLCLHETANTYHAYVTF